MQTTREIEKTTRTVREMAEVQRDTYEALAENFAATQRRGMRLAEGVDSSSCGYRKRMPGRPESGSPTA